MPSAFGTLHGTLQQVLLQRLGWSELREVQEQAYAKIASGKDVLVIAPTAGGKSEAAMIPVIDSILKNGNPGVSCLYLSPLKALINDQEERFSTFCTPAGLSVLKWHGDVPKGSRAWAEDEPPHILMITPESLEVLLMENPVSPDLRNIRFIIVDEVHAFVDTERGAQLICLLDRIDHFAGNPVQRIGLSATVGNPEEVLDWFSGGRRPKEVVEVPAPPKEKRFTFTVEPDEERRMEALAGIVRRKKALVFVNSRADAERVAKALKGKVDNLSVHHSSLSPELRRAAESVITGDSGGCIICTSTLELGIDIGDLDVVVQVGPPNTVSSFLQRMGRSGRRKRAAFVAWLLKNPLELLFSASIIECAAGKRVEPLHPPRHPYNVLIQQMFLPLVRKGRCSKKEIVQQIRAESIFRALPDPSLDRVIDHLISEGYLVSDGDMVMPGGRAEQEFGRSNWKDLYSVIAGGGEFRAVTPDGEVVGTLDARFVTSRSAQDFSLGGASWQVVKCDEDHGMVVVVPGYGQKSRVFWTGGEGGFSPLLCTMVQKIIAAGGSPLPLTEKDRDILRQATGAFPSEISRKGLHVTTRGSGKEREVTVFSFRGRKFNRILSALLARELGPKVQIKPGDIAIQLKNTGKDGESRAREALERIHACTREEIERALSLPPRNAWKFAGALPEPLFREMVMGDYFGVEEFMEEMARTTVPEGSGPGRTGLDNERPEADG